MRVAISSTDKSEVRNCFDAVSRSIAWVSIRGLLNTLVVMVSYNPVSLTLRSAANLHTRLWSMVPNLE